MHTSMRTHIGGTHGIRSDILSGPRVVRAGGTGGISTHAHPSVMARPVTSRHPRRMSVALVVCSARARRTVCLPGRS
eukprot:6209317-Prymnesium_polylepis.1